MKQNLLEVRVSLLKREILGWRLYGVWTWCPALQPRFYSGCHYLTLLYCYQSYFKAKTGWLRPGWNDVTDGRGFGTYALQSWERSQGNINSSKLLPSTRFLDYIYWGKGKKGGQFALKQVFSESYWGLFNRTYSQKSVLRTASLKSFRFRYTNGGKRLWGKDYWKRDRRNIFF